MKMRRWLMALALTVGVLGLLAPSGPAEAVSCTHHQSEDVRDVTISLAHRTDGHVRVRNLVRYRHCVGSAGNHWVDALSTEIGCRRLDNKQYTVQEARFNNYYWDSASPQNTFNPGTWTIECNSESWHEETHFHPDEVRMYRCTQPPRWRSDITIALTLRGDVHTDLAGTMWGVFGPTPVPDGQCA